MNPEEIERLENIPFFKEMYELGELFSYLNSYRAKQIESAGSWKQKEKLISNVF